MVVQNVVFGFLIVLVEISIYVLIIRNQVNNSIQNWSVKYKELLFMTIKRQYMCIIIIILIVRGFCVILKQD